MVSVNFRLGDAERTPRNCYKRGLFAQDALNSVSHLAHEIQEGDTRAALSLLRRTEISLRGLAEVSTKRDAAAAERMADKFDLIRRALRTKTVSMKVKLRGARLLEQQISRLRRGVAASCNAR